MDNKKLNALGTIHRGLGIIEGVSNAVPAEIATALIDAVEMIDTVLEDLLCST